MMYSLLIHVNLKLTTIASQTIQLKFSISCIKYTYFCRFLCEHMCIVVITSKKRNNLSTKYRILFPCTTLYIFKYIIIFNRDCQAIFRLGTNCIYTCTYALFCMRGWRRELGIRERGAGTWSLGGMKRKKM